MNVFSFMELQRKALIKSLIIKILPSIWIMQVRMDFGGKEFILQLRQNMLINMPRFNLNILKIIILAINRLITKPCWFLDVYWGNQLKLGSIKI